MVVGHIKTLPIGQGYDARAGEYGDLMAKGIVDPAKVTRSAIENAASISSLLLTTECLIVETHLDAMEIDRPAMIFYPESELGGDPTNWWGPNHAAVRGMLLSVGFERVEVMTPIRS